MIFFVELNKFMSLYCWMLWIWIHISCWWFWSHFFGQMFAIETASIINDVGINSSQLYILLQIYDTRLMLIFLNLNQKWPIYVVKRLFHNLANINMFMKLVVNRNLFYIEFVIPLLYLRKQPFYWSILINW